MSRYFINGANKTIGSTYPYDSVKKGASNFYELIMNDETKVNLKDGDEILVVNPVLDKNDTVAIEQYSVDDSANDIEINVSVIIKAHITANVFARPKVKLKSDGYGFIINGAGEYSNGTLIKYINLHKDTFANNTMININTSNNILITDCDFTYDTITGNGISIQANNSNLINIENNSIQTPAYEPGYAIKLTNNCNRCDIINNVIDMRANDAVGLGNVGIDIDASVNSHDIKIKENLIYNFYNNDYSNIGISVVGNVNNVEIVKNAIRINSKSSIGIRVALVESQGKTVIKHNLVILENGYSHIEGGTYGIYIPYVPLTNISDYIIVNNVIYYNDEVAPLDYTYAFNVGVKKGIIDYNDVYNFPSNKIFYWDGNPLTISAMGEHSLEVDPRILTLVNSADYSSSAYFNYESSADSECLGTGQYYENMGLGNNNKKEYLTFVDTVNHEIGKIEISSTKNVQITFLASTFTESIDKINTLYGKGYTSGDVFENQFSWNSSATDNFPFTSGNDLYDKDLFYVIKNKGDLVSFDNIYYPPNPGYGFSAYPDYETGLFGNLRTQYNNE